MIVVDEIKFQKCLEWYMARAKSCGGIVVTKDDKPWLVLISAEEYDSLGGFF